MAMSVMFMKTTPLTFTQCNGGVCCMSGLLLAESYFWDIDANKMQHIYLH